MIAELVESFCVPATHPSLPGHFPGQPVVPGVVLLDHIAACLERAGAGRFKRIPAVKFLSPLLPEQIAELHILLDGQRARFRVTRDEGILVSGEGELA
jgi:3-hydroxymyristoyl/3-hydroxydecanoyl-(acyl carrier protein) dehydratase